MTREEIQAAQAFLMSRRAPLAQVQAANLSQALAAGLVTIDFANGSDSNDGVSAPLRTWSGGIVSRLGPSVVLPSNLTIQLLNGPNNPLDRITWDVTVINGARFVLRGGTTQLAADSLTSVTARARSTNTPWQLGSLSGFGGSLTHQSVRVASKNVRCWVDAALDATHARITEPVAVQTPPTAGFVNFPAKIATLAPGDAYVVESMMPIYMGDFTVHGQMRQSPAPVSSPPGSVTLYQLQALNPYTQAGLFDEILLASDGLAQNGEPQFILQECRLDTAIRFDRDGAVLLNCRTTGPMRGRPDASVANVRGPILFAGGSTGFDAAGGGSIIDHKFDASSMLFDGDWLLSGATLYVYGTTTRVGAIGVFDCDDGVGIEIQAGATLYVDATGVDPTGPAIWGDAHSRTQGAGTGIFFRGGGRIAYAGSAANLTLTSSGGVDFAFGAASTGFAVDPNTNALSAATALSWSNFQKTQGLGGFGGVVVRNDTQNAIFPTPAVNV